MKPHTTTTITIMAMLASLAITAQLPARPIDFGEVSLWVRFQETDQFIVNQAGQRKLMRALTPQQEAVLKAQGASDSLVQSLRNPNVVATAAEVAATEVKSQPPRMTQTTESANGSFAENVEIFRVHSGQAINLSEWGGPDYEMAFNVWRYAGEDVVVPVVINTTRSFTDVATYSGPGFRIDQARPDLWTKRFTPYPRIDLQDNYYMTDTIGIFAASISHWSTREMSIDWHNPVFLKGVPYELYPVYGVRGVSLYYIGNTSDSVTLAVERGR